MTGLESIQDELRVQRYLRDHGLRVETLMPDWPGWDTPHLMEMQSGGIVPTTKERLLSDVYRYEHTGNAYHCFLADAEPAEMVTK